MTIVAINGSYRAGGITDQLVAEAVAALQEQGAEVQTLVLRDIPIEFCRNCRACTQQPGEAPGDCVIDDGMAGIIAQLEAADGYILACPTNFGSVTALFKRFMERLVGYAYWPWGKAAPKLRKAKLPRKKALLLSSSAAPGLLARLSFGTPKQLTMTAKTLGAKVVGRQFVGLVALKRTTRLSSRQQARCRAQAVKLLD